MTQKIFDFLRDEQPATPCLVVDLDVVRARYDALTEALPLAAVHYAVKANPAPEVISVLKDRGANFDVASRGEIDLCLSLGIAPERISFGNTIKKAKDIEHAYASGVRYFAFDSEAELHKIAQRAPGSSVVCRILVSNKGADWPLSRKFGCTEDMAYDLLLKARDLGLVPTGVSFHVGSQQKHPDAWATAVEASAEIFAKLEREGVTLTTINIGGGLPARYTEEVDEIGTYANTVMAAMTNNFGNFLPHMIVEPGRYLVGDAGVIQAEVILVSKKAYEDEARWVYLDIGRFNGLAETEGEMIKYAIRSDMGSGADDVAEKGPVILAGPSCDSVDILYQKTPYELPVNLQPGDTVQIYSTGAYTTTYSSVGFNGFEPLKSYYV